jgi:hypothetical protein
MNWFKDKKDKASSQAKDLRAKARSSWQAKYGQTVNSSAESLTASPLGGTPFGIPLREATNASKSPASGHQKVPAIVFRCIQCILFLIF